MKSARWIAGALLLSVAACANPPPPPAPVVEAPPPPPVPQPAPPPVAPMVSRGPDGVYVGSLTLVHASSQQQCPEADGAQATMTVQNGRATINMTQGMVFNGRVMRGGRLTLTSSDGPSSRLFGRLAHGTFNARGSGRCAYAARLTKQPG